MGRGAEVKNVRQCIRVRQEVTQVGVKETPSPFQTTSELRRDRSACGMTPALNGNTRNCSFDKKLNSYSSAFCVTTQKWSQDKLLFR